MILVSCLAFVSTMMQPFPASGFGSISCEPNAAMEDPEKAFDPATWAGQPLANFEAKYGQRGVDLGSGVHIYAYTVDGTDYHVQSADNVTILAVVAVARN